MNSYLVDQLKTAIPAPSLKPEDQNPEKIFQLVYRLDPVKEERLVAECFEFAAQGGVKEAQLELARCRWWGFGLLEDKEKAVEEFTQLAKGGMVEASQASASCYLASQFLEETEEYARLAIEQGDPSGLAHYHLGNVRYFQEKYEEAFRLQNIAAERGNLDATFELSLYYLQGLGVKADPKKGRDWAEKAAENGHYRAAYNMGAWHATGEYGSEVDIDKTEYWYRRASSLGNVTASETLCVMYGSGEEIEFNIMLCQFYRQIAFIQSQRGLLAYLDPSPLHHAYLTSPINGMLDTIGAYYETQLFADEPAKGLQLARSVCAATYEYLRRAFGLRVEERWLKPEIRESLKPFREHFGHDLKGIVSEKYIEILNQFSKSLGASEWVTNQTRFLFERAQTHIEAAYYLPDPEINNWATKGQEHREFLASFEGAQLKITQADGKAQIVKDGEVFRWTDAWFLGRYTAADQTYRASWALTDIPEAVKLLPVLGAPAVRTGVNADQAWTLATQCADFKQHVSVVLPNKMGEDYLFLALGEWRYTEKQNEELVLG